MFSFVCLQRSLVFFILFWCVFFPFSRRVDSLWLFDFVVAELGDSESFPFCFQVAVELFHGVSFVLIAQSLEVSHEIFFWDLLLCFEIDHSAFIKGSASCSELPNHFSQECFQCQNVLGCKLLDSWEDFEFEDVLSLGFLVPSVLFVEFSPDPEVAFGVVFVACYLFGDFFRCSLQKCEKVNHFLVVRHSPSAADCIEHGHERFPIFAVCRSIEEEFF